MHAYRLTVVHTAALRPRKRRAAQVSGGGGSNRGGDFVTADKDRESKRWRRPDLAQLFIK